MQRLRNRLIVAQLGLSFVIGVLVVIAMIAVQTASRGRQRARELANHEALTDGLRSDLRRFSEASHRFMLTGDSRDRSRAKALELQLTTTAARVVGSVRHLDGPSTAAGLERSLDAVTSALVQRMVGRPSTDDTRPLESAELLARTITFEAELAVKFQNVDEALERVRSAQHDAMNVAFERADRLALRARWTIAIVAALSLAIGAVFTIAVLRELARQSRQTRIATELGKRVADERRDLIAASHDLRSPLSSIAEHVATLRRLKLRDPEELDALASIAKAAKRVDDLLVSLVEVSRIQKGTVALRTERCLADHLIERATRALGRTANERAIRLRSEASATSVYADPDRIVHVLTMLIELAMAPARAGAEITLGVAPSEGAVRFSITSGQLGALPESLSQMFGPSAAPEPPVDRPRLEIYLCRRVVEAHGGRMGFETHANQGTTWFELPVEPRLLRS